jgi:hypothetical protein
MTAAAPVGRANNILDNLLAEKKAVPMMVVMPSGWTPSGGQVMTAAATKDPFNDELMKDIIPFVEANLRGAWLARCRSLAAGTRFEADGNQRRSGANALGVNLPPCTSRSRISFVRAGQTRLFSGVRLSCSDSIIGSTSTGPAI